MTDYSYAEFEQDLPDLREVDFRIGRQGFHYERDHISRDKTWRFWLAGPKGPWSSTRSSFRVTAWSRRCWASRSARARRSPSFGTSWRSRAWSSGAGRPRESRATAPRGIFRPGRPLREGLQVPGTFSPASFFFPSGALSEIAICRNFAQSHGADGRAAVGPGAVHGHRAIVTVRGSCRRKHGGSERNHGSWPFFTTAVGHHGLRAAGTTASSWWATTARAPSRARSA